MKKKEYKKEEYYMKEIDASIFQSLEKVKRFIKETTGESPGSKEIANALQKYFVLNEIKEHVIMEREALDMEE